MHLIVVMCLLLCPVTWQASAQETAVEILREVDHASFWKSFEKIPAHMRYSRAERRTDGSAHPLVEVSVHRSTVPETTESTSGGMAALVSGLLPEDPPYLADKYVENYQYSMLPDTLLLGRLARVIHVSALPARGRTQPVQAVRYFIDVERGNLVALSIRQSTRTLFYSESSTCFVQIRALPGLDWVPHLVRIATRLKLPLRPAVSLLRTEAFYSYTEV